MFAVNMCLRLWWRCTCLVSCPLHRHLFWTALTNYSSTGIYSQNVTSSSGPTRVPVRDLRQPGFLHMTKTTVICFGWTWQSSELCRLQVLWYSVCLPAWWWSLTFLLVTCTALCGTIYNVTSLTTQELARNVHGSWQHQVCKCMLRSPRGGCIHWHLMS